MIRRRILYLAALAGCLVFYGFYQEWVSWVMLLAVMGLPWLSLALSLPAMLRLHLESSAPGRVRLGENVRVGLSGVCPLPQPPVKAKLRLTRVITGESWTLRVGEALPAEHCGGLTAEPVKAKVYDYLGLFSRKLRKNSRRTAIVWPEPVKMEVPPDLNRYLAKSWRPKFGGGYSENHELRLYRPGDSLNQVHWKLSAKTGKLILREPMEPQRGLMLLTMDLNGTAEELDLKFGRLLWLGGYLLERNLHFQIRAMTEKGLESWSVSSVPELRKAVRQLLCTGPVTEGSIRDHQYPASWQYHVGGGADET